MAPLLKDAVWQDIKVKIFLFFPQIPVIEEKAVDAYSAQFYKNTGWNGSKYVQRKISAWCTNEQLCRTIGFLFVHAALQRWKNQWHIMQMLLYAIVELFWKRSVNVVLGLVQMLNVSM